MKPIYLILVCIAFSCQRSTTGDSDSQSENLEVIEKRTAGEFELIIFEERVPENVFTYLTVVDKGGLEIDNIKLISQFSSLGCETEVSNFIEFSVETQFTVFTDRTETSCGLTLDDPNNGVSEAEFSLIDDPYQIIDRVLKERTTTSYKISESGKIEMQNSETEIIEDQITGLNRFDVLPTERIKILRNQIFAKYGYIFKSEDLKNLTGISQKKIMLIRN